MEIYRVETANTNEGPYTMGNKFSSAMISEGMYHDIDYTHPIEGAESFLGSDAFDFPALRWGFESLSSLRSWFDPFKSAGYNWLVAHDFVISVYEIRTVSVHVHLRQVTFNAPDAQFVRFEKLTEDEK